MIFFAELTIVALYWLQPPLPETSPVSETSIVGATVKPLIAGAELSSLLTVPRKAVRPLLPPGAVLVVGVVGVRTVAVAVAEAVGDGFKVWIGAVVAGAAEGDSCVVVDVAVAAGDSA